MTRAKDTWPPSKRGEDDEADRETLTYGDGDQLTAGHLGHHGELLGEIRDEVHRSAEAEVEMVSLTRDRNRSERVRWFVSCVGLAFAVVVALVAFGVWMVFGA